MIVVFEELKHYRVEVPDGDVGTDMEVLRALPPREQWVEVVERGAKRLVMVERAPVPAKTPTPNFYVLECPWCERPVRVDVDQQETPCPDCGCACAVEYESFSDGEGGSFGAFVLSKEEHA